jgi:hypothetical protein
MYMEDNGKPEDFANKEDAPLAFKSDYEGPMDVAPISDPDIFSEQQRFAQSQTVYQVAKENPDICDRRAATKRLLSAMKVPAVDEIIPDPSDPKDENPAAENMQMGLGQPARALPQQDHLAHLQTHLDFYQSEAYGQNIAIKPKLAVPMLEHLTEHLVLNYGKAMQDKLKMAIGEDYNIDEIIGEDGDLNEEISRAIAAASPLVTRESAQVFANALPIIAELTQYVQSITPKPPIDPGTAMIEGEKMRAQTESSKIATQAQTAMQKTQATMQDNEKKLQAQIATEAMKSQVERERIAAQEDINSADNLTALLISDAREESDNNTRNISQNANPRP